MSLKNRKARLDRITAHDFNTIRDTIRDTAEITGLSEKFLRKLQKENRLPGIYSGTRFMVNYASLLRYLDSIGQEKQ